jgi:hypothetical protein
MIHLGQRSWGVFLAALAVFALASGLHGSALARPARTPAAAPAAPAPPPVDPVVRGTELYDQGQFAEGASLVRSALDHGSVPAAEVGAARELLARLLIKAGNRGGGRDAFVALLRANGAYRPDPGRVPPDERAVFDEALGAFRAWEVAQGRRVPASVGAWYGYGRYGLKQVNDGIRAFESGPPYPILGTDEIKGDPEFGGSVRFPLGPRLALEVELVRFNSSVSDSGRPSTWYNYPTRFQVTAVPLVFNLHYAMRSSPRMRLDTFAGAGPMLVTELLWTRNDHTSQEQQGQFGSKTGFYGQLGLEGEYMVHARLGLNARVLGRLARTPDLIEPSRAYQPAYMESFVGRDVDFSGFGFDLGLRLYIGA